jgi:hypothetical protein
MSTTFSVFPLRVETPTFREVLDLSTEKLNSFLKDYEIDYVLKIEVKLLSKENDAEQNIDLDSLAKWGGDFYAWFTVSSIAGGADSYYWEFSDEDKSDNLEEFLSKNLSESRKHLIRNCLENKIQWHFRRSAGQLGITTLAYGFIASSFADLTEGIISSEDGGWDYQTFPATAKEFDAVYFRPEKAISEDNRKWAKNCIEDIL